MSRLTEPKLQRFPNVLVAGDIDTIHDSFAEAPTWNVEADMPIAGPWHARDRIVDGFLAAVIGEHLRYQR